MNWIDAETQEYKTLSDIVGFVGADLLGKGLRERYNLLNLKRNIATGTIRTVYYQESDTSVHEIWDGTKWIVMGTFQGSLGGTK